MEYLVTFFFLVTAHYLDFDHWLPWRMPSPPRIVLNYVIGTVGMLAPFAWQLWQAGEAAWLWRLGGFVLAAGLAPLLSYANDGVRSWQQTAREKTEEAALLRSQRGAHAQDEEA